MNIYELSRTFWNWAFENPDLVKPNHSAMFFFAIEHCNRLGWKEKFGFPTTMVMDAIGIKSYNTFIATLNDLVKWGFFSMIEKSKNQYSANIIAISKFNEANDKALDEALLKHLTKQSESTIQSIDSIDIQTYNTTNLQTNNILLEKESKETKSFDRKDFKKKLLTLGVLEKHADDWIQARKNKRASFTESVIDAVIRECEKYNYSFPEAIRNCAENSWQGFKYEWLNNLNNGKSNNTNPNNGPINIRASGNKVDGTAQLLSGQIRYFEPT